MQYNINQYLGRKFEIIKTDRRRKKWWMRLHRPFILVDAEQEEKPQLGLSAGFVHFKDGTGDLFSFCGVCWFEDHLNKGWIVEIV